MPHFFDLFSNSHMTPSIFLDVKILQVPWGDLRFSDFHQCLHRCVKGFPIQSESHQTNLAIHGLWMVYVEIHPQPMMRFSCTNSINPILVRPFEDSYIKNSRQFEAHPIISPMTKPSAKQVSPLPCVQPCWWHELSRSNPSFTVSRRLRSAKILKDLWRHFKEWKDGTCLVFRNRYIIVKTVEPW